jgi:hypothetical protein
LLTDMMGMLQKISKNGGAGGDGILDDLLGLLGLRGLLGGGRNKGKNNKPDEKDGKKPTNNDKKTRKKFSWISNISQKVGGGRRHVNQSFDFSPTNPSSGRLKSTLKVVREP